MACCNHNHKLLASGSAEIKPSGFWRCQHFANFKTVWPPIGGEIKKSAPKKLYIRSNTIVSNHVFRAARQNGRGNRHRKVQFSELQKLSDLDLGSGQGHISIHNTCRTTSIPNHVTAALCSTEIWPFEIRVISTLCKVLSHVIAFLGGNSKIVLRQDVD